MEQEELQNMQEKQTDSSQFESSQTEYTTADQAEYIRNQAREKFSKGLILGFLICMLLSSGGFLLYRQYLIKNPPAISSSAVDTTKKKDNETHYTLTTDENGSTITEREDTDYESIMDDKTVQKMRYILSVIDQYYYLNPVTDEEMKDGIYKGILNSLGDPYSVYYTQKELDDLMQDTNGIYYGIGAYVSLDADTNLPKISGVIEGTPAEEAGLRSDDLIYAVDDVEVYGYELNDAVNLIRGEEGTQVTLKIVREGEMDYMYFTVTRAKVESPTVTYKKLENGIAYIQITQFDTITVPQFNEAIEQAKADGMEKMIIDLRDNPGGSLSAVVDIADVLLPEGLVVYTEDKNGKREEYTSDANCIDIPMVCLVNGNSASASEILSGAIKDYEWGTLIGTTTYGKGIVQQIIPFNDGTGIKLTISSYFTPKGNNIHGTGISPDIELELDKDAYYAEESVDNQLEEAIKYLNEQN